MGRKIPGKKHRGVKNPEKQHQQRLEGLRDKINLAPTNSDEQHVPKSLTRLIELKDKVKEGTFGIKRKRKHNNLEAKNKVKKGRPEKATPVFNQLKGESDRNFLSRVSKVCREVIKESHFEDKYGVDIKRNIETGEVEDVVKRKKDEIEKFPKKNKKKTDQPRLTKSQKRQKKLTERKQKKNLLKQNDFDDYKDEIKFGETVHAPPALVTPKKAESLKCAPRPGKKNLLLKSILNNQQETSYSNQLKITNKTIDKKGKRKNLPNALRRTLDKQQEEIVLAYKELKAKKYKS